ncbi:MAG: GyrI-like domain-containing protein [Acidimicrobiia bacterium]
MVLGSASHLAAHIDQEDRLITHDVSITEVAPQQVMAIKMQTSLATIGDDFGKGFGILAQGLARQDAVPTGAPLTVYHSVIDAQTSGEIEICIPVAEDVGEDNDVYGRVLEGGNMATSMHRGPYDQIGPVYETVASWITEHGHEIVGPPREVYLSDPQEVAPEDLLTRVEYPIG